MGIKQSHGDSVLSVCLKPCRVMVGGKVPCFCFGPLSHVQDTASFKQTFETLSHYFIP